MLGSFRAIWSLGLVDRRGRLQRAGLPKDQWTIDAIVTDRRLVLTHRDINPKPLLGIDPTSVQVARRAVHRMGRIVVGQLRWDWVTEVQVEARSLRGTAFGFGWPGSVRPGHPTHLRGLLRRDASPTSAGRAPDPPTGRPRRCGMQALLSRLAERPARVELPHAVAVPRSG